MCIVSSTCGTTSCRHFTHGATCAKWALCMVQLVSAIFTHGATYAYWVLGMVQRKRKNPLIFAQFRFKRKWAAHPRIAPMCTPPISESAELAQWSLFINHHSENEGSVPSKSTQAGLSNIGGIQFMHNCTSKVNFCQKALSLFLLKHFLSRRTTCTETRGSCTWTE